MSDTKEFKREPRYVVFKIKDVLAHCSPTQKSNLEGIGQCIAIGRSGEGKPPFNAVVVEQEWPEFEPVWAMIEARTTGKGVDDHKELIEQLKKLPRNINVPTGEKPGEFYMVGMMVRQAINALEQADALNAQKDARILELERENVAITECWGASAEINSNLHRRIRELEAYNATRTDELLASVQQASALAAQVAQLTGAIQQAIDDLAQRAKLADDDTLDIGNSALGRLELALKLSTKTAKEVLAKHDDRVIEPFAKSYDAALERLVIAAKYIPQHLHCAYQKEWEEKKAALRAAKKCEPLLHPKTDEVVEASGGNGSVSHVNQDCPVETHRPYEFYMRETEGGD